VRLGLLPGTKQQPHALPYDGHQSVGSATARARPSTINEDESRRAVAAVIETHRLGFPHLDVEQLASIWDRKHEPLIYVAQEKQEPIHGWTIYRWRPRGPPRTPG
jgi:hypothetical protein